MPSIAESVAARIAALLTGTTNAGPHVYRDREDAMTREESPAILIESVDEDTTPLGGASPGAGYGRGNAIDQDEGRVVVTACIRGANWQQQADALRVQAHALIVGDGQLLALVRSFRRDRCEWRAASADLPFGYSAQIYRFLSLASAQALDQAA